MALHGHAPTDTVSGCSSYLQSQSPSENKMTFNKKNPLSSHYNAVCGDHVFFPLGKEKDSARSLSFFFSVSVTYFYGLGLESLG